jgi:hypothetical protein
VFGSQAKVHNELLRGIPGVGTDLDPIHWLSFQISFVTFVEVASSEVASSGPPAR